MKKLSKMKKTTLLITSTLAVVLLASCASTSETAENESAKAVAKAPTVIEVIQETPEALFLKSLEGITISKISSPKEVVKGKSFA